MNVIAPTAQYDKIATEENCDKLANIFNINKD